MIYRFTFFLAFICCASIAFAQPGNLVENPSFEFRPECDDNNGPLEQAPPWFSPTDGTPDVFHECAVQNEDSCPYPSSVELDQWAFGVPTNAVGCQEPRTGVGYSGIIFYSPGIPPDFDSREYSGIRLSSPLEAGETYLTRFFVSLAEMSLYSVGTIQVLFTTDSIFEDGEGYLDRIPSLTTNNYVLERDNWQELSWEYTAIGGENFMYIGNFQPNQVVDTLFTLPEDIDPEDHFNLTYYYIDDVYVGTEILSAEVANNNQGFSLYPNPAHDELIIEAYSSIFEIRIFSPSGKQVFKDRSSWNDQRIIAIKDFSSGLYVLQLVGEQGKIYTDKFVKR